MAEDEDPYVEISWYEHNCEWITKHCEENHKKAAFVSLTELRKLTRPERN